MFNFQALSMQQLLNTVIFPGFSSLANSLWIIATNGKLYQAISILSIVFTIFALYIWYAETCEKFQKKGLLPKAKEMITPLVLIALMFGNANDMKESMFNTKNTLASIKAPLVKVVDKNNIQSATDAQISSYLKSVSNRYLLDLQ
jgi:hypothetical protein